MNNAFFSGFSYATGSTTTPVSHVNWYDVAEPLRPQNEFAAVALRLTAGFEGLWDDRSFAGPLPYICMQTII